MLTALKATHTLLYFPRTFALSAQQVMLSAYQQSKSTALGGMAWRIKTLAFLCCLIGFVIIVFQSHTYISLDSRKNGKKYCFVSFFFP